MACHPLLVPGAVLLLAGLALGGCNPEPALVTGGTMHAGSLIFTGKLPEDHLVGWLANQDCSAVRAERRGPWCVPHPGLPAPPPYCTRSIGGIDCWTAPPPDAPLRGVADPATP